LKHRNRLLREFVSAINGSDWLIGRISTRPVNNGNMPTWFYAGQPPRCCGQKNISDASKRVSIWMASKEACLPCKQPQP